MGLQATGPQPARAPPLAPAGQQATGQQLARAPRLVPAVHLAATDSPATGRSLETVSSANSSSTVIACATATYIGLLTPFDTKFYHCNNHPSVHASLNNIDKQSSADIIAGACVFLDSILESLQFGTRELFSRMRDYLSHATNEPKPFRFRCVLCV